MKIYSKLIILTLLSISTGIGQELQKLGAAINTEYNELHPVIAPDGETLYFVRISHPSNNHGKDGSGDVWFSQYRSDGRWSVARKMPSTINKDRYNDLFCITPDGNTILIRGVYIRGRKQSEVGISKCQKTKTGWTQPEKVDIPKLDAMCKGQYLTAFMTNNGKVMILSFSEKKGGKSDDLYVSLLDREGKWSKPVSLGADINTSASETAPFIAADNTTLYFASDRKDGEGGMDIWVSKRKDRTWEKWSKPINLGPKINTPKDEYFYTISATGEYAYLSSSFESVGKSDIIRYRLTAPAEAGPVVAGLQSAEGNDNGTAATKNKKTQEELDREALLNPTPVVMLSGRVIDTKTKRPIEAKIIYESFLDGEELGQAFTDPVTGQYKIVLPYGQRYTVRAESKDFITIGKTIDLQETGVFKELTNQDLELAPIQDGVSVTLSNIFFKFGKAALEPESEPELNRMLDVLKANPNMTIEIQGHTDNVGSAEANLKLSQERADVVRDYFLAKNIPLNRVASVGFGESKPIATNATTEGQAKNRRVEFMIIKSK